MKGIAPDAFFIFAVPFLIAILLSSCEDCYECGFDQPEPAFNVKFINEDSLIIVNDSIDEIDKKRPDLEDSLALNERKELEKSDSLLIIEDEIILAELRASLQIVENRIDTLESEIASIRIKRRQLEDVREKILAGNVALRSIESSTGNIIPYNVNTHADSLDSLGIYPLPLDMNSDFATYFITIVGLDDNVKQLTVEYSRETVTEDGRVIVKARNLSVVRDPQFLEDYKKVDSIVYNNNNELGTSDEAVVYLFF